MNSMMSGNTEAQVNAALALIKLKHKNKEMDPKLGELGMIKDRMENQILESKYKKIGGRNHSIKREFKTKKKARDGFLANFCNPIFFAKKFKFFKEYDFFKFLWIFSFFLKS